MNTMKEKENKSEKASEPKKFRLLRNPEQTSEVQVYMDQEHTAINIPKNGYHFSMDKEMDKTIQFLKDTYGFVEVN
jgi:hypothetical protein